MDLPERALLERTLRAPNSEHTSLVPRYIRIANKPIICALSKEAIIRHRDARSILNVYSLPWRCAGAEAATDGSEFIIG